MRRTLILLLMALGMECVQDGAWAQGLFSYEGSPLADCDSIWVYGAEVGLPKNDPFHKEIERAVQIQAERTLRQDGEQVEYRGSCMLLITVTAQEGPSCGDRRVMAASIKVIVPDDPKGYLFHRYSLDVDWQDELIGTIQQRVAQFAHEYFLARWTALGEPEGK